MGVESATYLYTGKKKARREKRMRRNETAVGIFSFLDISIFFPGRICWWVCFVEKRIHMYMPSAPTRRPARVVYAASNGVVMVLDVVNDESATSRLAHSQTR